MANAGERIGGRVTVTVENVGSETAFGTETYVSRTRGPSGQLAPKGYLMNVVLSSDEEVVEPVSQPGERFVDDVELSGGGLNRTPDLSPGASERVWPPISGAEDNLEIPLRTPTGKYFVCAVVDPLDSVEEKNEDNNVDCFPLTVKGVAPRPTHAPVVPEPVNFNASVTVYEDDPDFEVDLSDSLSEDFVSVGWAEVESNDNPGLVVASLVGQEVILGFAKDGHGSARVVVEGADLKGRRFTVSLMVNVEPVNDAPVVAAPMGDMRVRAGDGSSKIPLDLLETFHDPDLSSNHDRLTFRVSNDNASLLSYSLQDSDLTLHLQPGQHGEANIRITATDQSGLWARDGFVLIVEPEVEATQALPAEAATDDVAKSEATPVPTAEASAGQHGDLVSEDEETAASGTDWTDEAIATPFPVTVPSENTESTGSGPEEAAPVVEDADASAQAGLEPDAGEDAPMPTPPASSGLASSSSPTATPTAPGPTTIASAASSPASDAEPVPTFPTAARTPQPWFPPTPAPMTPTPQPEVVRLESPGGDSLLPWAALAALIVLAIIGVAAVVALALQKLGGGKA